MNYFEFYPGDYQRDTGHLSLAEHGAFLLLLAAYYGSEKPFPNKNDALFRITKAISSAEKKAAISVANQFFPVGEDGLRHNARADAEIAKAAGRMEGSEVRKANDNERKRRSRERRAALFEQLRAVGIVPDAMATMAELDELVTKHVTSNVTPNVTRDSTGTRPQTPDPIDPPEGSLRAEGSPSPDRSEPRALSPTLAGECCLAARQGGLMQTNPSHPGLLASLAEGASPAMYRDTATEAVRSGKGFAWVIATIRGRLADAARAPPAHPANTPTPAGPTSKTGQAILALENLKHGNPVDPQRNLNGPAAAALPQPRTATGQ